MQSNEEMVGALLRSGAINERIAECMLKFPRAGFLPESLKKDAYRDSPLPISSSQTTSAPSMAALSSSSTGARGRAGCHSGVPMAQRKA